MWDISDMAPIRRGTSDCRCRAVPMGNSSHSHMCLSVALDELVQGCMEWAMSRDMQVLVEGRHFSQKRRGIGCTTVHFTLYDLPEKV